MTISKSAIHKEVRFRTRMEKNQTWDRGKEVELTKENKKEDKKEELNVLFGLKRGNAKNKRHWTCKARLNLSFLFFFPVLSLLISSISSFLYFFLFVSTKVLKVVVWVFITELW